MPTITELPNDVSDTVGEGLIDSDHQLQPMDYEHTTGSANSSVQRDAGRVSIYYNYGRSIMLRIILVLDPKLLAWTAYPVI